MSQSLSVKSLCLAGLVVIAGGLVFVLSNRPVQVDMDGYMVYRLENQWYKIDFGKKMLTAQLAVSFADLHKSRLTYVVNHDSAFMSMKESDAPSIFTEVVRQAPSPPYDAVVSPNGESLLLWGLWYVVINESDQVHVIKLPRDTQARAFAWNPDSTAVAFYYADNEHYSDLHIQQYGLAMVTAKGEYVILRNSKKAIPSPDHIADKYIPPQWSPDGEYVYYYEGVPKNDLEENGLYEISEQRHAAITYRVSVRTKEIEKIAYGTFMGILPDGERVLLSEVLGREAEETVFHKTAVYNLKDKKLTILKLDGDFPLLSPSGKYAAVTKGRNIYLYRVNDWQKIGESPLMDDTFVSLDDWLIRCAWIEKRVEDKPQ